jgi:hypothetical protein
VFKDCKRQVVLSASESTNPSFKLRDKSCQNLAYIERSRHSECLFFKARGTNGWVYRSDQVCELKAVVFSGSWNGE